MKPGSRETLLMAVAKARKWVKGIERGQTFADIAVREGKAERYIRHLARLAGQTIMRGPRPSPRKRGEGAGALRT
jgi:hypothetical protein